jgi:putative two-component system response regulator
MNAVPATPAAATPRATVLVVDDTPANLSLLSNVLNKQYRVQVATSGHKALEIACATGPRPDRARRHDAGARRLRSLPPPEGRPAHAGRAGALPDRADPARGRDTRLRGRRRRLHPQALQPGHRAGARATHLQLKALLDASRQRAPGCRANWKSACAEVDQLRDATLHVMVSFAEFRDEDTGNHVRRTQEYVRTLARWLRASGHRPG